MILLLIVPGSQNIQKNRLLHLYMRTINRKYILYIYIVIYILIRQINY